MLFCLYSLSLNFLLQQEERGCRKYDLLIEMYEAIFGEINFLKYTETLVEVLLTAH